MPLAEERLCQAFRRAACIFVPRDLHPAPKEGIDFSRMRPKVLEMAVVRPGRW